ncbi:unnamed protein product [Linum trigynum]|uniref:Uncharacterized protein n=1 Tax=Linum trigynum TaxID=586398 RepID=A0AAV2FE09_9ROSI
MAARFQIEGDDSVLLRVTHFNLKTFSDEVRCSLQVSAPSRVTTKKEEEENGGGAQLSDRVETIVRPQTM